ncbi:MAG: diacylglycerol kinase family protein [Kofleriaceae bacterium]
MTRRRVAIIVNAAARGARDVARRLAEEFRDDGVRVTTTAALSEARGAVYEAVERGAEVVLFGGGDGTLAMGLTLLEEAGRRRAPPAIGVLRMGTGNAFARAHEVRAGMGGHRAQVRRALNREHTLRPFRAISALGAQAPFCGFGVDAQLIADHDAVRRSWLGGRLGRRGAGALGYAVAIGTRSLPRWALTRRPEVEVRNAGAPAQRLDARGEASGPPVPAGAVLWAGPCTMAAASTIRCFGFGLQMFPFAAARADRFQLRASDAGLTEILWNTPAAFRGTYTSARVHDFLVDRVELTLSEPAPFELGGEVLGELKRVELALGPQRWTV